MAEISNEEMKPSNGAETETVGTEQLDQSTAVKPTTETDTTTDEVEKANVPDEEGASKKASNDDRNKTKNGARSTFDLPESSDPDEIRNQVEFYFGDSNLPIDKYLFQLTGGHKNQPVPLKQIHQFKRMRHFQPYSAVREAVKASTVLNLDDDDNITRKKPLDEKFTDDVSKNASIVHSADMARSIYVKGFGHETSTTHTDIEEFFAPYGPIRAVRLRRHEDGHFKGSVFVEFDTEETQQKFLNLEQKPEWNGESLNVQSKKEYVDTKHQGILDGIVKPSGRRNNGKHSGAKKRDWIPEDEWKARREQDQEKGGRWTRGGGNRGGRGGRGGRSGRGGRGGRDRRDRDDRRGRDDNDDRDGGHDSTNKRSREDDGKEDSASNKVRKVEDTSSS